MQKRQVARSITHWIIGGSVGFTVGHIIKNNVDIDENAKRRRTKQAEAAIGGVVIGSMAAEMTDSWVDRRFDKLEAIWDRLTKKPEETVETPEDQETPTTEE